MLKLINEIRFIPKTGVEIEFWSYHKYFHFLCFYFYWHHNSIFEVEDDEDKQIQEVFKKSKGE